jgi:hypothetical protein
VEATISTVTSTETPSITPALGYRKVFPTVALVLFPLRTTMVLASKFKYDPEKFTEAALAG